MTTDELITAFGGREAVAQITGAKPNAITQWRLAGVPYRHWPSLIEAASSRGINGVTFEALRQTRPAPQEAA